MTGDPSGLFRILYRSRCGIPGSDAALEAEIGRILEQSRAGNAKVGLTGALMLTASLFVQVLEGPADAIEATFERICCDLRHTDLQLLEFTRIDERAFAEWSMSRVHADGAISALFANLIAPEETGASSSEAADRAVDLMRTLLRLESARHPKAVEAA